MIPLRPERLLVFLKVPRLGKVKTRIAAQVGDLLALEFYQQILRATLEAIDAIPEVELRFAPDEAIDEASLLLRPNWTAVPQGGGNLGDRLARATEFAFKAGYRKVVVIGSDCPEITAQDIFDAFAALEKADLVLGPAKDGGYWLLGLRQPCPLLFQAIPWSTAAVFTETCRRATEAGLQPVLLRELSDIDTLENWRQWLKTVPFSN